MKSFRDRNPYAVGIVSVLLLGLLTGASFAVGLLNLLADEYEMEGVFPDAAGLRTGDEVKLAGVKVGRVTEIEADRQNGRVIVTWAVNSGVRLGQDMTAEIALETLLGAKHIRLDGSVEEPYLEDLDRDERVIPIERTEVPFDIFELARISTEQIEATATEDLNAFINDLADVTEGKRQEVTDLIEGLDLVSTAIVARDAELDQLLERAEALSGTLADKDDTLVMLIDASRQVLALVSERRAELSLALGQGAEAVTELTRVIEEHELELDRILSVLHPTLDVVAANQDTLDTALAWLGPAFLMQVQAGTHGPWLDIYVRDIGTGIPGVLCDLFAEGDPECAR